jgi:hypothetical protein
LFTESSFADSFNKCLLIQYVFIAWTIIHFIPGLKPSTSTSMSEENSNKRCKISIPNEELLALLADFCNKLKGAAGHASYASADFFKAARNFKTVFADTVASARARGEGAVDAMLGVCKYQY